MTRPAPKPAPKDDVPVRRIDRVLTFMSLGLLVVSIGCFFATIVARGVGYGAEDFTGGWLLVNTFPLFALPVAFLCMIAVLVMSFVRRGRANRGV